MSQQHPASSAAKGNSTMTNLVLTIEAVPDISVHYQPSFTSFIENSIAVPDVINKAFEPCLVEHVINQITYIEITATDQHLYGTNTASLFKGLQALLHILPEMTALLSIDHLPTRLFHSFHKITEYMIQLMHFTLVHYHYLLAYQSCEIEDLIQSITNNWSQIL
ncbi:hypothetical protein DSO57_1004773 [Entomophthora muscae]|uniref:Uncharacterized protein n=1 Tax=Entomophthora muscae TaxID=34485 RepID=A0ACC2UU51_9FUNG|nr:hypothetical protein DSO57_1004773 [Entomophthora muscae]